MYRMMLLLLLLLLLMMMCDDNDVENDVDDTQGPGHMGYSTCLV